MEVIFIRNTLNPHLMDDKIPKHRQISDDEAEILYDLLRRHYSAAITDGEWVEEKRSLVEYALEHKGGMPSGFIQDLNPDSLQFWFSLQYMRQDEPNAFDEAKAERIFSAPVYEPEQPKPAADFLGLPDPVAELRDAMKYLPTKYTLLRVEPEDIGRGAVDPEAIIPHWVTLGFRGGFVPLRYGEKPLTVTIQRGYERSDDICAELGGEVDSLAKKIQARPESQDYSIEHVPYFVD